MKAAGRLAWWLAPPLICVALYWSALKTWFQGDDFAWLGLSLQVHDWRSFLSAMFAPMAQGTIRPLSERGFFMLFYELFGLEAVPYRIWVFLTEFACLALVASITRRLTGSRAAGFLAAILWLVNTATGPVLSWTSVYNQAMCAFFLLLAFYFLLRYIETGRRRYWWWQWAAFLLGFGALELNVVYPALSAAYTWLCARKYFRRTLPMFGVSAGYAVVHILTAPRAEGLYASHYDASIFHTLGIYWRWTFGGGYALSGAPLGLDWPLAAVLLMTAVLLAFALRHRSGLFFLFWYLAVIAPLLPLRDHVTDYYTYIPAIGLAMLGGWALASALRGPWHVRAAGLLLASGYVALAAPKSLEVCRYRLEHGRIVAHLVRGLAAAHELHPDKTIVLDGVGSDLFWFGIIDRPWRLFGARVYLTPESQARIAANPDYGDIQDFVLPAAAVERALDSGQIVIYNAAGQRLRNVTKLYAETRKFTESPAFPRNIEVGNPLLAWLLGPEWYPSEEVHRWMPKRATLRMGGPSKPGEALYVSGACPEILQPLSLDATVDGIALAAQPVPAGGFTLRFPLPDSLTGKQSIDVALEVNRTHDDLGIAVSDIRIR